MLVADKMSFIKECSGMSWMAFAIFSLTTLMSSCQFLEQILRLQVIKPWLDMVSFESKSTYQVCEKVCMCLNYLNIQEVIFFNCMSISMVASFIQNQTLNWNEGTDWFFYEKSFFLKISPICTFNMWLLLCNVSLAFTLFDRMF